MRRSWIGELTGAVLTLVLLGAITGCGAAQRPKGAAPAPDLGAEISTLVAQLHPVGGSRGGQIDRANGMDVGPSEGGATMGISTLMVGNLAYVGIDMNSTAFGAGRFGPTHAGGPDGGGVNAGMEPTVRSQVRSVFPQVADVFITTEPDLVYRIARVAGEMQAGGSVSGRVEEIYAIARQMTPVSPPVPTTLPDRGGHH